LCYFPAINFAARMNTMIKLSCQSAYLGAVALVVEAWDTHESPTATGRGGSSCTARFHPQ